MTFPPHKVAGYITIYCVEGRLTVSQPTGPVILLPGQLMFLNNELQYGCLPWNLVQRSSLFRCPTLNADQNLIGCLRTGQRLLRVDMNPLVGPLWGSSMNPSADGIHSQHKWPCVGDALSTQASILHTIGNR